MNPAIVEAMSHMYAPECAIVLSGLVGFDRLKLLALLESVSVDIRAARRKLDVFHVDRPQYVDMEFMLTEDITDFEAARTWVVGVSCPSSVDVDEVMFTVHELEDR